MTTICKLFVDTDRTISLNNGRCASLVIRLASRWAEIRRDFDEDGWHQTRIDPTAMTALDNEAPVDVELFRQYCRLVSGPLPFMDNQDWIEVRDFITTAAARHRPVMCIH